MAISPSLSLWSSIKIPFLLYGKNKNIRGVSLGDSCNGLKQENNEKKEKPVQETVNLRVPSYLSKIENSTPNLFFCTLSGSDKKKPHRKCSYKSKTKQINHVTIPNEIQIAKKDDWEETFAKKYEENILNSYSSTTALLGDELNISNLDSFLENEDYEYIPSVKPWTQEQLDEVSKKYNLSKKEKVKTTGKKKKKMQQEGNVNECITMETSRRDSKEKELNTFEVLFSETSRYNDLNFNGGVLHNKYASNHPESDFDSEQNYLKSHYFTAELAKMKKQSANADYYENKLADLYALELGIKI